MDTKGLGRRAAIYCRVSSIHQGEDGTSLDTQEKRCRDYCAAHMYEVVLVQRDMYTGAKYRERPGLRAIRDGVRAREVDVVVTYDIDRLARNQAHLYIISEEIEDHGARLEFVTETFEDSAVGRFIRSAKGFAAEVEREKIAERASRGRKARVEAGKLLPGSKPLYGYTWADATKSTYAINPREAVVVRRIYRLLLDGKAIRQIAFALIRDGIPSPMGKQWSKTAVHRVLRAEQYTGIVCGWSNGDEVIMLPDGTIPPLIDHATFDAAQDRLAFNGQSAIRNSFNPEATLLRAGFVKCGTCGRTMRVQHRKRGGYYYRCSGADEPPYLCSSPSIGAGILDAAVWDKVAAVLTDPDIIARELVRLRANDPTQGDLDSVDRALKTIDQQRSRLAKALTMLDDADADPVVVELASLGERKRQLEAERDTIQRSQSSWEQAQTRLADITAWCQRVARNVASLTYEDRRQALLALGVQVIVFPTGGEHRWRMTADVPLNAHANSDIALQSTTDRAEPDALGPRRDCCQERDRLKARLGEEVVADPDRVEGPRRLRLDRSVEQIRRRQSEKHGTVRQADPKLDVG